MSDQPAPSVPAGWYPDPITGLARYWDGRAWTDVPLPPPVVAAASPAARPNRDVSVVSIIGFIASIVALLAAGAGLWGLILLAGIFSLVGFTATKDGVKSGHGLAIAGLSISAVAVLVTVGYYFLQGRWL